MDLRLENKTIYVTQAFDVGAYLSFLQDLRKTSFMSFAYKRQSLFHNYITWCLLVPYLNTSPFSIILHVMTE